MKKGKKQGGLGGGENIVVAKRFFCHHATMATKNLLVAIVTW
jgi:hypothetical protein